MPKRQKIVGLFTVVVVAATLTMMVLGTRSQTRTPAQAAPLTEQQKKHAKLYSDSGADTLKQRADRTPIDAEIRRGQGPGLRVVANNEEPIYDTSLVNFACTSDAVVVGTIKDKSSHFNEEDTLIFTLYDVVIEEVLKSPHVSPLSTGMTITVSRRGGVLKYHGRTIRVLNEDGTDSLEIGERDLFYLSSVPGTEDYQLGADGIFLLNQDHTTYLTNAVANVGKGKVAAETLLNEARSATLRAAGCQRDKEKEGNAQ